MDSTRYFQIKDLIITQCDACTNDIRAAHEGHK